MLHTRLVSALKKIGATVTEIERYCPPDKEPNKFHKHFEAVLNGKRIDWHTQENFNDKTLENDGRLFVGFVSSRSPYTDVMTDCFCDSYEHTIKGAIELLT